MIKRIFFWDRESEKPFDEFEVIIRKVKRFADDIEITIFRPSTVYGHSSRMRFDLILNHLVLDAFLKKETRKIWQIIDRLHF